MAKEENRTAQTPVQICMEVDASPVVNYALQQNMVPLIRRVTIHTAAGKELEGADLVITASPKFCFPFRKHIAFVPQKSDYEIQEIGLLPDPEYLAGMTEKMRGVLQISLMEGEDILCTETQEITALAFDEWHGSLLYPELLAAFVIPNHPGVAKLNARAAELLEQWTKDPSLDAYQTRDPNRVLLQAAAIYGSLQEQNIVYTVPPASFEQVGQRVRLCDEVIRQKMGTCLDLTLLYAACLEAAGLHPLLILKQGHIFAGVWLEEMTFPEAVQDDASLLTKRIAEGVSEVAVVECTLFAAKESLTEAPAAINLSGWEEPEESADPVTRKTQWERKLLDLGLRNSLINMRLSKTLVPVLPRPLNMRRQRAGSRKDQTEAGS